MAIVGIIPSAAIQIGIYAVIVPATSFETAESCEQQVLHLDFEAFEIRMSTIYFYKPSNPHGYFSNFYESPIYLDKKTWPTVEHYFQAQKFHGTGFEEEIRLLPTPMDAKIAGQDKNKPLRSDWEKIKDDVMRLGVYAKFSQHENLKKLLLETGSSHLVEHTSNDNYWGDGGDGKGRNMLGHILMEIREKLGP